MGDEMNIFQAQLVFGDGRTLAERDRQARLNATPDSARTQVSIQEFERDMREVRRARRSHAAQRGAAARRERMRLP